MATANLHSQVMAGMAASQAVDDLNAKFYGQFPFPWDCMQFDYCADPSVDAAMLNQAVGEWRHDRVPDEANIWVAGCGTNQAIFAALRFPNAHVIGSDLSRQSLDICERTAKQMRLQNLQLQQESINRLEYRDRFDYVLCTGVIHHNADPAAALGKLAAALKPGGVLELMVYNRYHRTTTTAFQEVIRLLRPPSGAVDLDAELAIARTVLKASFKSAQYAGLEAHLEAAPAPKVADALIQPVEFSYTVDTLNSLAVGCGLTVLAPCINTMDVVAERSWSIEFTDAEVQARYAALDDVQRWQLVNLLLLERSPMLWFYMQRSDGPYPRRSDSAIDREFLDQRFARVRTTRQSYVRNRQSTYTPSRGFSYPPPPSARWLADICESVDGARTMREIFEQHGLSTTGATVNRARTRLTTPVAPYLRAIS